MERLRALSAAVISGLAGFAVGVIAQSKYPADADAAWQLAGGALGSMIAIAGAVFVFVTQKSHERRESTKAINRSAGHMLKAIQGVDEALDRDDKEDIRRTLDIFAVQMEVMQRLLDVADPLIPEILGMRIIMSDIKADDVRRIANPDTTSDQRKKLIASLQRMMSRLDAVRY